MKMKRKKGKRKLCEKISRQVLSFSHTFSQNAMQVELCHPAKPGNNQDQDMLEKEKKEREDTQEKT